MSPDRYAKYQNIPVIKSEEEDNQVPVEVQQPEVEPEIEAEPAPEPMVKSLDIEKSKAPVDPNDKYSKYKNTPEVKSQEPAEKATRKKSLTERFGEGLEESTSGQAVKLLREKSKKPEQLEEDPGFWETLVQTSGELVGDAPYLAAGATLGGVAGGAVGSVVPGLGTAIGAATGGTVGAFAFNEFLKESLKQYHDFQDKGGDLTFGEFISRADEVASKTLRSGAMGLALAGAQKLIPLAKNIPGINKLFDTKYVGKPLEKAAQIGTEVATATGLPAAAEGRMPTKQDLAVATALFAAPHAAKAIPGGAQRLSNFIPEQYRNLVSRPRYEPINLALAEKIQSMNLPFPALNELKGDVAGLKKNSVDLSNNLALFDAEYMNQLAGKIDKISPESYPSSRDAGLAMRNILIGEVKPISPVEAQPELALPEKPVKPKIQEPAEIPKPTRVDRPLTAEENPVRQSLEEISPSGFTSDVEGGRQISRAFHRIRDEQKATFDTRYRNLGMNTTGMVALDEQLPRSVQTFINDHSQSAAPGTPESKVLGAARQLLQLVAEVGEEGEVVGPREFSVSELIKTNQSLKAIPNWNLPGNYERVLSDLIETVNEHIVGHLHNENPAIAREFQSLNQDYRMFKQRFDNTATRVLFDPTFKEQAIHGKFSKIDGFNQIAEALNVDPEGQQVANRLRRDVWQEKLGDGPLAARTESQFVDSLSRMNEREFSNLMEYLTPEQRVAVNRRIQDVNRMRDSVNQYEQDYAQAQENYREAVEAQKRDVKNQRREAGAEYEKKMREHKKEVERLKKEEQEKRRDYENAKINQKNKSVQDLRNEVTEKQDLLVSILEQNPAKIVDNLKTEEGIIRLKKLTKDIPGGPEMFQAAAKFETENMFSFVRDSLIENSRVPYNQIRKVMSNREFRAKLKALNGEEFVKSMDELVSVADDLSDIYKTKQIEFIDDPAAYGNWMKGATLLGLHTQQYGIPLLMNVGKKLRLDQAASSWWNKNNYTQEGISKAVKTAKALRKGTKQEIKEAVNSFKGNP